MDLVLGLDLHVGDGAGHGCLDRDLHLHRLEDGEGVAFGYGLADLDMDLPHIGRDLGMDFGHKGQTTGMGLIGVLISIVISGLIVGALGRLAIPGPNPMSIGMTIAVGIGGALIGGIIGRLITESIGVIFVLEVLVAAAIVWFMQRRDRPAVR